ncbi:Macrolide export ATP-binding/permease protein MacB [Propionicimonas sp. T2.31MG-18]|uniref:ABC transporter permease n=1 Tax=Propionicimonas sp. T2.31MG-18 TaxID=3157620 RepID=UPI0035F0BAE5
MNLTESLRFAWRGVTANKVRSALTMLGVLIGVAAVIVLVAVGNGASRSVTSTLSSLGTNTLTVTPGTSTTSGLLGLRRTEVSTGTEAGTRTRPASLTSEDAAALADPRLATDVTAAAAVVSPAGVVATYSGASHQIASTIGTTSTYLAISNDQVSAGRTFTATDEQAHARVVLVGTSVAEALGVEPAEALLGHDIELNGTPFTVIGILVEKGSAGARDSDDRVIAPLTAVQDRISGYGDLSSIAVQAGSADTVTDAQAQVEAILDQRHRTSSEDRDFTVITSASMLSAASSITGTLTIMLGAIAAISLLVGGIGVMNIMLVTVTERTREIGVRKAIGADRSEIILQFLIEATLLSVIGGLAGMALGALLCQVRIAGFQLVIDPWSVLIAFGFALAVGLFFGIYPATRAAALRPIDALRHE